MSSTVKVLQVIPKLGFGGAETGCYDLAHFLAEQDCKSYLITSGGELLKYVRRDKVKIIRLPVQSKNPIIMFLNFILIYFIILIYNINIVHARSRAPAWSCLWACLLSGRKFVTTFHGTYNFSSKMKLFYNSVMVRSKLIIAGSNFIFKHINENYEKYLDPKKKKLMVIFRGINLEYFNSKSVKQAKVEELANIWKIDKNKFTILLPGRLTRWKGQESFIEALSYLREIHNKDNFTGLFKQYCINNKVKTKWGDISLVKATLNLFKEAFQTEENKFFVLLSDKCIPLYSADEIYSKIFFFDNNIILSSNLHRERYHSLAHKTFFNKTKKF